MGFTMRTCDGPVSRERLPFATVRPLPADAIRLDPGGFLGAWQNRNGAATIPHCIAALEESGAVGNLRRLVDGDGAGRRSDQADADDQGFRGFAFADSDVYKTLEAVSWESGRTGCDAWEDFAAHTVALLARVQEPSGYLNSNVQGEHPGEEFANLRWGHEFYCLGHLIQAAVARVRVTGRTDLLDVAQRFADHVVRVFGEGGRDGLCGHPQIESALVELSRLTGDESYTRLAAKMIDLRGRGLLGSGPFEPGYHQDAVPVRELTEATGHAVRQLYLAVGVTDVYLQTGEQALLDAMERLWASARGQKMYLTGGMGSHHKDESFGDPYELPPDRAYAETCAGIASVQWNWRMLLATGQGRFADELERALLNVVAASTSVDGTAFFYSNPLHLRPGHDGSSEYSPSARRHWFSCACCPPNVARLIASLHCYVATHNDDGLQLHLYGDAEIQMGDTRLVVRTRYPWDGVVHIDAVGAPLRRPLSLRIPAWAQDVRLVVDGVRQPVEVADGYVSVRADAPVRAIELDLGMRPQLVAAHPYVDAVRGCVAVQRGPIVHCCEQTDLPAGVRLEDVAIASDAVVDLGPADESIGVGGTLVVQGVHVPQAEMPLYGPADGAAVSDLRAVPLTAIPYYAWANRGEGAMRVWVPMARSGPVVVPAGHAVAT